MSIPATKEELKTWCLRELGFPVIQINVDDDQVDDAIDSALQYYQNYHYDAMERWYLKHQMTSDDITNEYIPITENVFGVTRVFPVSSTNASVNMFDLRYQLRLHELYDFTSTSYVTYTMTKQHIRTLDLLFSGETPVRFNRHTDRLYIDWDWGRDIQAGEWIIIEGWIIIDPDAYTDVWNDRMLKSLATAHIKKRWGNNMRKFQGVQLLGGITMNGQQIYEEAKTEITELEEKIRREYEEPPQFTVGAATGLLYTPIGLKLMEYINHAAEMWNNIPMV